MMRNKCLLAYVIFIFPFWVVAQNANLTLANAKLAELAAENKYGNQDIEQPIITDEYTSKGITHIYYQQAVQQIGVYGSSAAVHIKEGIVVSGSLNFLKGIEKRNIKNQVQVQALAAVAKLAQAKNYPLSQTELLILETDETNPTQPTTLSSAGISNRTIPLKLVFIENNQQDLQLAWSIFIDEIESANYKNFIVNAITGEIEKEVNLTITCHFDHDHSHHEKEVDFSVENRLGQLLQTQQKASPREQVLNTPNSYHVYPLPVESPNFGNRSIVTSPWDANSTASPNGWHQIGATNFTTTRGNNVDAYEDSDRSNSPTNGDAARTDGGATLTFDNPLDVNGNYTDYRKAAITNLFYWSNMTHDVWYNYGFDEPSGNFQADNFNRGGTGNDYLNAEAQDGSGTCNANFSTSSDGLNPRMQMYGCGNRDGDFDNMVIVHEYGHGISTRLTGGPGNASCLNNREQMGEGWSDWFGLMMTIQAGDNSTKPRTLGTWLFQEEPDGGGIRPHPYTTDMQVNPMTYGTIAMDSISAPHGVGSVWATMLWDLTWAMIDRYGWDADIYNGTGGNNRTMSLVIEGLKLQPCSPGFVDGREAILQADRLLYGGDNQCLIWSVFARRGLGFSASQGFSGSKTDGTEAFDMPPNCTVSLEKTTDKTTARPGEEITYDLRGTNALNTTLNDLVLSDFLPDNLEFVSASDGGQADGQTVTWPNISLDSGQSFERSITAKIKNYATRPDTNFVDDFETSANNWTVVSGTNSTWALQSNRTHSGAFAYYADGGAPTQQPTLTLSSAKGLTNQSELIFHHYYDIESDVDHNNQPFGWDAGVVQISTDNGHTWQDLGDKMTQNGYNMSIYYNFNGFSGESNGWIETKVNLSEYAGLRVLIRFEMRHDDSFSEEGWYIDDVILTHLSELVVNQAQISNGTLTTTATVNQPTNVVFSNLENCTENLTAADFNSSDILTNDYRVIKDISSNGIVKNGSTVNFYAGHSIILEHGFHSQLGSSFTATIAACEDNGGQSSLQTEEITAPALKVTATPSFAPIENKITVRPNPFHHNAIIDYQVRTDSPLWIGLYDITGQLIQTLHPQSVIHAGIYQLNLEGSLLENGAYWLTMRTADDQITKKVFVIKN